MLKTEHIIYNSYSQSMRIDPFAREDSNYVDNKIQVYQGVDGNGIWQTCEISNTGFGSLTVERAREFSAAWPVAIEIAERWNILRAGKPGKQMPVTELEQPPAERGEGERG